MEVSLLFDTLLFIYYLLLLLLLSGVQQEADLDGVRHCKGPRVPRRAEICAQGHCLQVGLKQIQDLD